MSQPASSSWLGRFLMDRRSVASPVQKNTSVLKCSSGIPPVPTLPSRGIGVWTYVTTSHARLMSAEGERGVLSYRRRDASMTSDVR